MSAGIYVHVPFCLRKCPYCDFYSVAYDEKLAESYVRALCRHIEEYEQFDISADTIYFGGGTPSLLNPEQINRIISKLYHSFKISNAEITMEANPSSSDYQKLCGFKSAGVNRISFGVQSADNNQLKFLGRLHDFDRASEAVFDAYRAGIENISCDIMLGLAGQDMGSLNKTIDKISLLPVKHVSAYMLKIEEGTLFDNEIVKNSVADEDLQCDMYLNTVNMLGVYGFEQYEISNFARDKQYSRHNLKYWQGDEYIGFGPAAHSFFQGKRFCIPRDIQKYIKDPLNSNVVTENSVDETEEYIMLSLRLKWGISLERVKTLGGKNLADSVLEKAYRLENNGLCRVNSGVISLTPKGFLVSNSIITMFLE